MKAAELCAGYGGLALAIEEVFGAETAWVSEFEEAPSKILAHHWPNVPNHGDMTTIDWAAVEPVDIISGGTPCQDLSAAGRRKGMTEGTRSNLWVQMREAIATIKPAHVVWENVRGAYSAEAASDLEHCPGCMGASADRGTVLRALGRVLGDLSDLGYDCQWRGLRAADVGAPHGRFRVFILATRRPTDDARSLRRLEAIQHNGRGATTHNGAGVPDQPDRDALRAGPIGEVTENSVRSGNGGRAEEPKQAGRNDATQRSGTRGGGAGRPAADSDRDGRERRGANLNLVGATGTSETHRGERERDGDAFDHSGPANPRVTSEVASHPGSDGRVRGQDNEGEGRSPRVGGEAFDHSLDGSASRPVAWGEYEPAIRRWEAVVGRRSPAPTDLGRNGKHRLSPRFAEWMMGVPDGWIVDVPGISRNDALKAAGNGVVPQQAIAALRDMLAASVELEATA